MTELETIREQLLADCAGLLISFESRDEQWEADRVKAIQTYRDYLFPEDAKPVSPRVQIVRRAKAIIEALNLPEGGGVYWNGRTWKWGYGKPAITGPLGYETWSIWAADGFLPQVCLDTWPSDWRESWITRTTEEV
jgi:hypothetical protein